MTKPAAAWRSPSMLPMQRGDFEALFEVMNGYPVTVRLLDPPLHEFVPQDEKGQREMAAEMNVATTKSKRASMRSTK